MGVLRGLLRKDAPAYHLFGCEFSISSIFLLQWHHILWECHQYFEIVEPLVLVGAILLDIAITVLSKAGILVTLEVIKEIQYRFFGFGVVFFFGRCLCRRCLHKL